MRLKLPSSGSGGVVSALLHLIGGDAVSKSILVIINILLIRRMHPPQFAAFATMFALIQFSYQAACGVIERLYIAEHARFRGHERVALNILMLVASAIIVGYLSFQREWLFAAITVVGSYAFASFQLARIRLQKDERYRAFVAIDAGRNMLALVMLLPVFVLADLGDWQAFVAVGVFTVSALCADLVGRRWTGSAIEPAQGGYRVAASLLLGRGALIAYALAGALFPFVPIFLANGLSTAHTVAAYGVALRYQSILSMLVVATNVYMLPRLSNVATLKDAVVEARVFFGYLPYIVGSVVIYMVIVWFAMPILNGPGYDDAQPLFVLLSLCALCSLVSTPLVNLLLRQEMYGFMLTSMLAGLATSVIVGVAALPWMESWSFGIGLLCGYVVTNGAFIQRGVRIMHRANSAD
jgi:O-antigen/teichoic acid export membrane protein